MDKYVCAEWCNQTYTLKFLSKDSKFFTLLPWVTMIEGGIT